MRQRQKGAALGLTNSQIKLAYLFKLTICSYRIPGQELPGIKVEIS